MERKLENSLINRSPRQNVFCEKGVLKNFAKFTGKHLCQRLFFNKAAGMRPATLIKKRPWQRCFPVNFAKFLRTPFSQNSPWKLLLRLLSFFFWCYEYISTSSFDNSCQLRSSCREVFCKKDVLKKFHKIPRKTPVPESLI